MCSIFLPQEVIDLTKDLLNSQPESTSTTNGAETVPVKHGWKTGDKCMAVWSQDGQWVSLSAFAMILIWVCVIVIIVLYCILWVFFVQN